MNIKSSFNFLLITLLCFSMNAQDTKEKVLTAENYQQAAKFLPSNVYPLADLANVRPNWLENGKFWYTTTVNSERKYVLVDSKTGKMLDPKAMELWGREYAKGWEVNL